MTEQIESILISTGTTGGHLFPALSFAKAYARRHREKRTVVLIPREDLALCFGKTAPEVEFCHIPIDPFPHSFSLKLFSFLVNYVVSVCRTLTFIIRLHPKALISFGSYGTFPSVVAAWLLGVPIVVHEQNRVLGRANRCAARFAELVAISFPRTLGASSAERTRYVGYPLRSEIERSAEACSPASQLHDSYTVFVLGGSQGAQVINDIFIEMVMKLSSEEKRKLAVIHIAGERQREMIERRYRDMGMKHQVFGFSDRMESWYERADLVIARAGAGTIFELAAYGLPAILIPYPYAYSHQAVNAAYLLERGAACVIDESDLTAERLRSEVFGLLEDAVCRKRMGTSIRQFHGARADERLVEAVDEVASFGVN